MSSKAVEAGHLSIRSSPFLRPHPEVHGYLQMGAQNHMVPPDCVSSWRPDTMSYSLLCTQTSFQHMALTQLTLVRFPTGKRRGPRQQGQESGSRVRHLWCKMSRDLCTSLRVNVLLNSVPQLLHLPFLNLSFLGKDMMSDKIPWRAASV